MNEIPAGSTERDAAILAGTLCLMSCFAQHPLPLYASRIAENLYALADSVNASAEFRAVCARLAQRWRTLHDDAALRCADAPPDDARRLQ